METLVHVRSEEGAVTVTPHGELDQTTSSVLRGALDRALERAFVCGQPVVVNLAAVTFLNAWAIGALVTAHRQLHLGGQRLVVTNASPRFARALRATGTSRALEVRVVAWGSCSQN
ncbi:MAG TPA: STAS domain-containing protein [Dermatophilaceae bacterium]|nr:STAS domain-containing protein [Dermatophilaceae bacterium]